MINFGPDPSSLDWLVDNQHMIPLFKVLMSPKAGPAVMDVLTSGMIGEGPKVEELQKRLAKLFDNPYVVPVNSCTSALIMALKLAGVGPGDEVISTPFTMIATNAAITAVGATVRWADIDPTTLLITQDTVEEAITGRTKAIMATAVGGLAPDVGTQGLPIILDGAHAIGTTVYDHHISELYRFSCFSFQSIKQLTAGDGGALIVHSESSYSKASDMKWFGISRKIPPGMTRLEHQMTADVVQTGGKYHLNDISAAICLANMELLPGAVNRARMQAETYKDLLGGITGVQLPQVPEGCDPSWWLFWIQVPDRDKFMKYMLDCGITVSPMWRPNDEYSAFAYAQTSLPGLDQIRDKVVFIPIGHWLTYADVAHITGSIQEFFR